MTDGFRELFEQQFGQMVALARMLRAPNPEDVAQEAFLRVHMHWRSIRDPSAAPAYLRRTVLNLARNAARHEAIRRRSVTPDSAAAASAETVAVAREDLAAVLAAIWTLPHRQREALVLRHWSGLSYEEIAATLRTSAATARSLVHRARSQVLRTTDDTTLPQERT